MPSWVAQVVHVYRILVCQEESLGLVLFNAVEGGIEVATEPSGEFDAVGQNGIKLRVEHGGAIASGTDCELRLVDCSYELAVW